MKLKVKNEGWSCFLCRCNGKIFNFSKVHSIYFCENCLREMFVKIGEYFHENMTDEPPKLVHDSESGEQNVQSKTI